MTPNYTKWNLILIKGRSAASSAKSARTVRRVDGMCWRSRGVHIVRCLCVSGMPGTASPCTTLSCIQGSYSHSWTGPTLFRNQRIPMINKSSKHWTVWGCWYRHMEFQQDKTSTEGTTTVHMGGQCVKLKILCYCVH